MVSNWVFAFARLGSLSPSRCGLVYQIPPPAPTSPTLLPTSPPLPPTSPTLLPTCRILLLASGVSRKGSWQSDTSDWDTATEEISGGAERPPATWGRLGGDWLGVGWHLVAGSCGGGYLILQMYGIYCPPSLAHPNSPVPTLNLPHHIFT